MNLPEAITQERKTIDLTIKKPVIPLSLKQKHLVPIAKGKAKFTIFEETLEIELYYESVRFNYDSMKVNKIKIPSYLKIFFFLSGSYL